MKTKTFEEDLLIIRQLKKNVEEFRCGNFPKDETFLRKVLEVRTNVLEWARDIIYIMREKQFIGEGKMEIFFDLRLPKDIENFKLREFPSEIFQSVLIVLSKLHFQPAKEIDLEPEDAGMHMELFEDVIVDCSVVIEILKGHYGITNNFDIAELKI